MKKVACLLVVAVVMLGMLGCKKEEKAVPLGDIIQNWDKYDGKTIVVDATVKKTVAVGGQMYYLLMSDTGEVRVLPRKNIPPTGERVKMVVEVHKKYEVNGKPTEQLLVEKKYLHVTGPKGKDLVENQAK